MKTDATNVEKQNDLERLVESIGGAGGGQVGRRTKIAGRRNASQPAIDNHVEPHFTPSAHPREA
jgi:hypothetical protein